MSVEPDPMRKVVRQTLPIVYRLPEGDEIVGEAELFLYEDTGYGAVVINNATMEALGATSGARFFPGISPYRYAEEVKSNGKDQD